eukprot:TRINITY_DN67735_c0_g1_i1.p1 TRINITY_DN67735_c0_g1~~TRINITY_DN67735_c0_g1_i1.p1  ORF type:complete len:446 (+),score=55.77 TRINITY_DN67735_c0_g1_i1:27-1340(+)
MAAGMEAHAMSAMSAGSPLAKRPRTNAINSASAPEDDSDEVVGGWRPFLVERFFAKHEFTAKYMLGSSDAEAWSVREILELAASRGDVSAAGEWADQSLGYTESSGHPHLRRAVARLYGGPICEDHVLGVVPQEGIFLAMTSLLTPSDVVVAMWPCYQSLHETARAKGCKVVPWRSVYDKGVGWRFSIDDLREIFRQHPSVRMVVANFPHNPTSWMPTAAEHDEVVTICQKAGTWLFSDEMYWGCINGAQASVPETAPLSSCVRYDRAISLSGLSKPYGLPGLRVGWLVTQNVGAMEAFKQAKDYLTICGSGPSETMAIIALRHGEALLTRAREVARRNRELLKTFCQDFADLFEWAPEPALGLVTLVVLRGWAAKMGGQAFADWCVQSASCVLVPSDAFEMPETPAVRFGLGRLNFAEALDVLRASLRARGNSEGC